MNKFPLLPSLYALTIEMLCWEIRLQWLIRRVRGCTNFASAKLDKNSARSHSRTYKSQICLGGQKHVIVMNCAKSKCPKKKRGVVYRGGECLPTTCESRSCSVARTRIKKLKKNSVGLKRKRDMDISFKERIQNNEER